MVDVNEEIKNLLEDRRNITARLNELGVCPEDGEPMPCLTCGAGL